MALAIQQNQMDVSFFAVDRVAPQPDALSATNDPWGRLETLLSFRIRIYHFDKLVE